MVNSVFSNYLWSKLNLKQEYCVKIFWTWKEIKTSTVMNNPYICTQNNIFTKKTIKMILVYKLMKRWNVRLYGGYQAEPNASSEILCWTEAWVSNNMADSCYIPGIKPKLNPSLACLSPPLAPRLTVHSACHFSIFSFINTLHVLLEQGCLFPQSLFTCFWQYHHFPAIICEHRFVK